MALPTAAQPNGSRAARPSSPSSSPSGRCTTPDDQRNRALGLYNTLGIHVYRGYIDKYEALAHWAGPIRQNWEAIDRFVNWRRDQASDHSKWPYLMWFAREGDAPISPEAAARIDADVAASIS